VKQPQVSYLALPNAHQHAKQLAQRGFAYEVSEAGKVKLLASKAEVFAAQPAKKTKPSKRRAKGAPVVEPEAAAEPAAPQPE
jgi:hypothetical protein